MKIAVIDPSMFSWPYDRELAIGLQSVQSEVLVIGCHGSDEMTTGSDFYVPHYYGGRLGQLMRTMPRQPARVMQGLLHCVSTVQLIDRLKKFRPDVIHFQWLPLPVIDGRAMRVLSNVAPIVVTIHNSEPFNGDQANRFQSLGSHYAILQADRVIVHTESAAARALKQGVLASRLVIIPHGMLSEPSLGDYPNGPPFDLLMFGKIRPYKGLDIFVAALEQIPVAVRKLLRVRIIGRPYFDLASLVQRVKDAGFDDRSLEFRPEFIQETEISKIFERSSAIVMPYRAVDASGILSLAIAHGRPVIGTKIDGLAEAVQDGLEALLVPAEDASALALAIERFATDDGLRQRLHHGMIAKRAEIPTWKKIAAMTTHTYRQVIEERRLGSGKGIAKANT